MTADPKAILRRWDELKALRLPHEQTWRDIDEYCTPHRSDALTRRSGELRTRRLVDASGMIGVERLKNMTFGFLVSPSMPFVRPSIHAGLIAAGRAADDVDDEGRDYIDRVHWSMHDHFMSSASGFTVAIPEALLDWAGKATGIVWIGRKRGLGARYQSRSLWNCWIAENEDGEIDTCYYAFELPAWRVLRRWPKAGELDSLKKAVERGVQTPVRMLMAVEPREGGVAGRFALAKPFMSALMLVEEKIVVEESGYDSFPYAVPRFSVRPGETYGYGPAHLALPDLRMLNAIMEAVIDGAEKVVDPPSMAPLRLFPRAIDRRKGAVNYYQASQLGLQSAEQAVRPLVTVGDINVGVELIREIRGQVEQTFFTDWMRLRENGSMTATEVNDRRDMRLRGMSPIVSRAERDLMGPVSDRTFEINDAERFFGDAPESLRGLPLNWAYTGPMALAQLQAQREAVSLTLALASQVARIDPAAAQVVEAEEALRVFAESVGYPPAGLKTRAAMEAVRQAQAEAEQRALAAQEAAQQATALRDGAQAVGTMAAAMRGGAPSDMATAA